MQPVALDEVPPERPGQPAARLPVLIDHGDTVALTVETGGEGGAGSAAADDLQVHHASPRWPRLVGELGVMGASGRARC